MNTQELAKHLYMEYARLMDIIEPQPELEFWPQGPGDILKPTGRIKPRLKWTALESKQQDVWLHVADVALRVGTVG